MGKPENLFGDSIPVQKTSEYLRHFGISFCPFSEPGGAQSFWCSHSMEELRAQMKETMMAPGLMVVSDPHTSLASPAREVILSMLDEDIISASIESLPDLPEELLLQVLTSFGFDSIETDLSECRSVLQAFLSHSANAGTVPVILLQQAEPASESVANEIGRLLNLREDGRPCVKLIMMGSPEAINIGDVKYNDLPISHTELKALGKGEVADFIFERLDESGLQGRALFTPAAITCIAEVSGGIPGVISQVCSVAMIHAFQQEKAKVTKASLLSALSSYEFSLPERSVEDIVVDCIAGNGVELSDKETVEEDSQTDSLEVDEDTNGNSENGPYFDMSRDGKHIARFRLDNGRLMIGRHKSNEIYVPSNGVSLFHAVVICEKNEAYIFDLRSTNGTVVNGRDIMRKRLSKGDTVSLGSLRLEYFPGAGATASTVSNILNFSETVVLEEDEALEPTQYIRSGL